MERDQMYLLINIKSLILKIKTLDKYIKKNKNLLILIK